MAARPRLRTWILAQSKIDLPRYVRAFRLKSGETGYYWTLPAWAKPPAMRGGKTCPAHSEPLGNNLEDAKAKAEMLNDILDDWRLGIERGPANGSVAWLFSWYQAQHRFTSKTSGTRKDYSQIMTRLSDEPMRVGTLGQRAASAVNAAAADTIYTRWRKNYGERQASYGMQVARLVWNWAVRHRDTTGVTVNPFKGMGISTAVKEGNRATSRAEYDLYRQTARDLGLQSMATAAALSFELCQRVWDVFGFEDKDGRKRRGFAWADYEPFSQIAYQQSKTGKKMVIPLVETVGDEQVSLFPELEAELSRTPRMAEVMVVDEKTGRPLTYEQVKYRHNKIRRVAGLPKKMTFTGFRHGGITELGDAGIDDTRPISGHVQLQTTAIYNRASQAKARAAQRARNRYLQEIANVED